jgi:hypothetical protein
LLEEEERAKNTTLPSLPPKMKKMTSPTQMRRTLATAVTMTLMAIVPLMLKKIPRRSTSQADH